MDYDTVYKQHNFQLYLDRQIHDKRIIIQLESLVKLRIDAQPIPSYDVVIMDESELLLNQLNSTQTFANMNKDKYTLSFE